MPATVKYDRDVSLDPLKGKTVAIIGYGSQGHAHALNLKESGVNVVVGLRPKSRRWRDAEGQGLRVLETKSAAEIADIIMMLVPDESAPAIYRESIEPNLSKGKTLLFAHGFNIHFGQIRPPEGVDVAMVAPKSPGHLVRRVYTEGAGVPCLVAVHTDASHAALDTALAYAKGIGSTRAGALFTTFQEETETDLFGEQTVLCGGVSSLMQAGYETLIEAGYQPEIAYFECVHELKLIVDLIYAGGLSAMRDSVSNTAEYGDYAVGPQIIDAATKERMRTALARIQSGEFARDFLLENQAGQPVMNAKRNAAKKHSIEVVGARLRQMMNWLNKA